jgi:glycine/D-amino acid oxidase-like deaminating enzyme
MKRIFGDFAYETARIKTCYWAEGVPDSTLTTSPLQGDQQAEVGIIGAGFTGLNAALHLAQDGISTTVVDAHFPGWGASGRNGGFCCLGGAKASSTQLTRTYGNDARRAYRQAEKDAVTHVADLLTQHHINADTHSQGETQMAHNPRAFAAFTQQAEQVQADYGLTAQIIPRAALPDHGLAGPFHGAMTIPHGFGLNPRKYLAGLLRVAHAAGARVHSHSPVTRIESSSGGYVLHLPNGRLRCRKLIIATNGYSSDDVPPWMAARYIPAQSSVLVTRPLTDDEIATSGWSSDQAAYDSRNLLHYFRLMPNRRFLFGMRGGLRATPAADAAIQRQIRREFDTMFPAWANVETPHYWSGMVCLAANLVPFCGPIPEMPGAFAGFAYHGNGVAMGSYTGTLLADLVLGKPTRLPHPAIMQTPPKRFPLGPLRRALMWPAYAVKALQDRA